MGNNKINWNKIATILSVVVALSSIGVFSFFKDSINKVQNVLESVDRMEKLETELNKDKQYYDDVIKGYKRVHYNDSVKLESTIYMIEKLNKKRSLDSSYIYWNYDWIVYLKKQHNL